jgi:hypothetical protein
MTDRELLEKAAKAADMNTGGWAVDISKGMRLQDNYGDFLRFWNPLTDDGDALRLAVKLQLTVANEHVSAGVAYCTDVDDNVFQVVRSGGNQSEVIAEDYAATRRAIVRAAAAIGESL